MVAEYKAKGSHLIAARQATDAQLGAGAFDRLCARAGATWGSVLLPGGWYEVAPLRAALAEVAGRQGRSVTDVAAGVARRNAETDLTTIYRVYVRTASPTRLLSFTPQLWRNYVQFAEARAVKNEPGEYVGECAGIPDDLIDWAEGAWLGFLPKAIEMVGATRVRGSIAGKWQDLPGPARNRLRIEIKYSK